MTKLILGSKSPRRKDILEIFTKDFVKIDGNIDEEYDENYDLYTNIMSISRKKAKSVAANYEDSIVIAADTVVSLNGKILGKAKTEKEAREYLKSLSGKKHEVITAFTIEKHNENLSVCDYVSTFVKFKSLSESDIDFYIKSGQWKDKAGAYGIQDMASAFIDYIEGDYFNVVGLPISTIYDYLKDYFDINLMGD